MAPLIIVVIDDSVTVCKFVSNALSPQGYQVIEAFDMETGLDLIGKFPVELVITDIFMPGLGGIKGIIRLRESWPAIKILAISGGWGAMNSTNALAAAIKIGADAVLEKPFKALVLTDMVEEIMNSQGEGV